MQRFPLLANYSNANNCSLITASAQQSMCTTLTLLAGLGCPHPPELLAGRRMLGVAAPSSSATSCPLFVLTCTWKDVVKLLNSFTVASVLWCVSLVGAEPFCGAEVQRVWVMLAVVAPGADTGLSLGSERSGLAGWNDNLIGRRVMPAVGCDRAGVPQMPWTGWCVFIILLLEEVNV